MAVKHKNVLLNLITECLYWLTTCFGQLHDHHHNGMEGTKKNYSLQAFRYSFVFANCNLSFPYRRTVYCYTRK